MAERVARVEEQTKRIPIIETKLDKVIDTFPKIYATKEEVGQLGVQVKSNSERIIDIIIKLSIISTTVGFMTKLAGLW